MGFRTSSVAAQQQPGSALAAESELEAEVLPYNSAVELGHPHVSLVLRLAHVHARAFEVRTMGFGVTG